jgi:hypothetical protein
MNCRLFIIIICLYNKHNSTWLLGNMEFISGVEEDIVHLFATLTREQYSLQHSK